MLVVKVYYKYYLKFLSLFHFLVDIVFLKILHFNNTITNVYIYLFMTRKLSGFLTDNLVRIDGFALYFTTRKE